MLVPASIISWEGLCKSPLGFSMKRACSDFDINLKELNLFDKCTGMDHYALIKPQKNVICWMCYAVPETEIKNNRNILFLENGLLDRGRSYYFDDNGWGVNSNIVIKGYNKKQHEDSYVKEVYDYLSLIGWPVLTGYKKDGPIMIATQNRIGEDRELIIKCKKYIPKSQKLIVRGHPATKKAVKPLEETFSDLFDNRCELDTIDDIFNSLARCRAVVANTSSVLFKALVMGIPAAACKRGFHSGTSAVLDCSRNESLLQYLLDYRFDEKPAQNLICTLREHSVSRNVSTVDQILRNTNFANWLKRMIIP